MELSDGFIVGVYNYCDRWCERCALTSRCRLFADRAEDEFERDHGPIGEPRAERLAREIGAAMERWEKSSGIDFDQIQRDAEAEVERMSEDERDSMLGVRLEHLETETRAKDLCFAIFEWLRSFSDEHRRSDLCLQVLAHFGFFVPGKVYRALIGLKEDGLGDPWDALGSAKAALLGLEQMRAACDALAASDAMSTKTRDDLLERINWLVGKLESTLPLARAFVRPGLDEPDEVARLDAGEPA
jgi:hypothetical protein